jgi:hypothetical protein
MATFALFSVSGLINHPRTVKPILTASSFSNETSKSNSEVKWMRIFAANV